MKIKKKKKVWRSGSVISSAVECHITRPLCLLISSPFCSFYLPSPSGLVRGHDCLNETTALPPPSKGTVRSNCLHWRQTFWQLEKTCKLQMYNVDEQNWTTKFLFYVSEAAFIYFFNCLLVINVQLFFLPECVSWWFYALWPFFCYKN